MSATTVGRPPRAALTALGCKVNYAEMADLAGALAAAGWDIVADTEHSDVRVVNSCTVTSQADATTRQRLHRLRRFDPKAHIVLTGCSVDGNPGRYGAGDRVSASAFPDGVDAVFANRDKQAIAAYLTERFAAPANGPQGRAGVSRSRAFIKVQDGCNHRCTYCIVSLARGASRSVPPAAVIDSVTRAFAAGHAEVVLCGVDLGSYGRDAGSSLPDLLTSLLELTTAERRIRLSSINANDVTPRLIELNAHPRLCAHWHLPLQSGSDRMLRAMHRGYRRAQYLRVVRDLRARDALTEFTTDVMVGFPGETEQDHQDTLALVDEVGYLSCHVFRWSPRPGTPAERHAERVDDVTARRRSVEVRRAAARTGDASRRRAVGRVHEVVWDFPDDIPPRGLSSTYHELVVDTHRPRAGTLATVIATGIDGDHLRAKPVAS